MSKNFQKMTKFYVEILKILEKQAKSDEKQAFRHNKKKEIGKLKPILDYL